MVAFRKEWSHPPTWRAIAPLRRDGGRLDATIRIPNSAGATDSFPEFILGWTIGGSAGVSPAAFGVLAECKDVCNGTLQTATGTVALPISEFRICNGSFPELIFGWTIGAMGV